MGEDPGCEDARLLGGEEVAQAWGGRVGGLRVQCRASARSSAWVMDVVGVGWGTGVCLSARQVRVAVGEWVVVRGEGLGGGLRGGMEQAGPQPVGLRAVPGEATGSFVRRLARVNDRPVGVVLREAAGGGRVAQWGDPLAHEVFLSDEGVERLATMAWRTPEELRRSLPTLSVQVRGNRAVRVAPWPERWTLLEPCAGCLARREDIVAPVWCASGEVWQVCVRHGRWMRDAAAGGPAQVGLAGLEDVVRAHHRWQRMRRRVGPYARALLADALQVAACWWQGRLMGSETVWARREGVLGAGQQEWSVPLVVYPEAVVVAEAMAVYERQRRWGGSSTMGRRGGCRGAGSVLSVSGWG